jgi:hypothetical protein
MALRLVSKANAAHHSPPAALKRNSFMFVWRDPLSVPTRGGRNCGPNCWRRRNSARISALTRHYMLYNTYDARSILGRQDPKAPISAYEAAQMGTAARGLLRVLGALLYSRMASCPRCTSATETQQQALLLGPVDVGLCSPPCGLGFLYNMQ